MELAWWLGESSVTEAAGLASFCAGLPGVSQSMEESAGRKVEGGERPRMVKELAAGSATGLSGDDLAAGAKSSGNVVLSAPLLMIAA
jgi:hypothetical protein